MFISLLLQYILHILYILFIQIKEHIILTISLNIPLSLYTYVDFE